MLRCRFGGAHCTPKIARRVFDFGVTFPLDLADLSNRVRVFFHLDAKENVMSQMPDMDRRTNVTRRDFADDGEAGGSNAHDDTGLERRRGPGRSRTDFAKSAEKVR